MQAHYSLKKAGLFLGIGMNNVIPIATDNAGHMVTSALDRQLQKDKAEVWAVVSGLQYDTIQLYCLYVEKFAFWLVIYIKKKHSIQLTIKPQQLNKTRS